MRGERKVLSELGGLTRLLRDAPRSAELSPLLLVPQMVEEAIGVLTETGFLMQDVRLLVSNTETLLRLCAVGDVQVSEHRSLAGKVISAVQKSDSRNMALSFDCALVQERVYVAQVRLQRALESILAWNSKHPLGKDKVRRLLENYLDCGCGRNGVCLDEGLKENGHRQHRIRQRVVKKAHFSQTGVARVSESLCVLGDLLRTGIVGNLIEFRQPSEELVEKLWCMSPAHVSLNIALPEHPGAVRPRTHKFSETRGSGPTPPYMYLFPDEYIHTYTQM